VEDAIVIASNTGAILRQFDRMPKTLQGAVVRGLTRGLLVTEDRVRRRTGIKSRHGAAGLMGRLTSFVQTGMRDAAVDGIIGFRKTRGFPYELSQEFGAKAKPGKAMAIPVTREARRYRGPRDFPGGLFVPHRQHVLAQKTRGGKMLVHYILVRSIPPRLRFRKTVFGSRLAIGREVVKAWREAKD
jgi:hypothetical protein